MHVGAKALHEKPYLQHAVHSWKRTAEFDLPPSHAAQLRDRARGPVVLVSDRQRDCDQEHIDCYRECMKRRLPSHLNHIKRGSGAHGAHCANTCLAEYMRCLENQQARALEFSASSDAVEWLKRHRDEVLVGSIIVIAGVAFVTISAGAGLVVLVPVVVLGSAEDAASPRAAGVPS